MSKVAFLLISDGREEYRERTHASAQEMVPDPDFFLEVDDSNHELGFSGAIQAGWERVISETDADWVFHCEQDFTFNEPVALVRMIAVLERHPHIVQMSLKRQAVNPQERAAGGLIEHNPDAYEQHVDAGDVYLTHRVCFTTNPSVYPVALCHQGWPQVERSEGVFTHRLLEDPNVRFGIWGAKYDEPRVTHIGEHRAGRLY